MRRLILLFPLLFAGGTAAADAQKDAIQALLQSFAAEKGDVQRLITLRAAVDDAILEAAISGLRAQGLPALGEDAAGTVIYEFSDYQCGYCRRMFPLVADAADAGDVQIAVIEIPILGSLSDKAARIALAAQAQGKFPAFHRALMSVNARLSQARIDAAVDAAGLDAVQMAEFITSGEADRQLEANFNLAALLEVRGTPTFIINGHIYRGALEEEAFRELLE